jgi:hypothetical protein
MIQYPNRCVIFADRTWPSNRWAVLGPEVSAQITEFIITTFASIFSASVTCGKEWEFTYVFFFFTISADFFIHL